ncbi:uncharacterized protein PAC_04101 [Phialocephala subalpina]|uniref:C2H2-type domain-containing protein n=1 Tax=Phialocephala subalpina TaxID=576137 RepID=A0A1L7WN92_9HELO|nr:uncharacterized protein PAC_04101 [Phialocephala subalpina]
MMRPYTPGLDNNSVLDPGLIDLNEFLQSGPDSGYNSLDSANMSTSGSHTDLGPGVGDQQHLGRQWRGGESDTTYLPDSQPQMPRRFLDNFESSDPSLLPSQLDGQFMYDSATMGDMRNFHTYHEEHAPQPDANHTIQTQNLIGDGLELRFSPKAVAFVKTWIEHSPGVPSPADIAWLAQGTGQQLQDIQQIFGHILRGNTFATAQPPKNSSIDSLANRAQRLQVRVNNNFSESEDIFKEAVEWVAQNPTSCRAQRDSRSSQDSTIARIYKCTVGCEQSFPRPDVWKEHEEKVHPPKAWLCNIGYTVSEGNIQKCGYCRLQDPDMNHWEALHSRQIPCSHKPFARGTTIFHPRKLFLSHLKNVHLGVTHSKYLSQNCFDVQPSFDKKCPKCYVHQFEDWNERSYHIRGHFEPSKVTTTPIQSKTTTRVSRTKGSADARPFGGEEMSAVALFPVLSISRRTVMIMNFMITAIP